MKRFFFIFLLFPCFSFGQNLIPNGDFELGPDSTSVEWLYGIDGFCGYVGNILGPDLWSITGGSPDRLVEWDIPCGWDNDTAQSGNAYVIFGNPGGQIEAGKTTLISPIQKDSAYHLSFYAQLERWRGVVPYAPFKIAIKFNNSADSIVFPQITDSTQWLLFDTVFIASANATEIEILGIDVGDNAAKIDNISIEKIPLTGIVPFGKEQKVTIYPNPTTGKLFIDADENMPIVITVYNSLGMQLAEFYEAGSIDLTSFKKGMYLMNIRQNNRTETHKIILR